MKSSRTSGRLRFLIAAVAVCMLLLGQAAAYPLVLCVSGTGHVEVETFNAGCCMKPAVAGSEVIAAHLECDGCTDLSLETASDTPRPVPPQALAHSGFPIFEWSRAGASSGYPASALPVSIEASAPLRC